MKQKNSGNLPRVAVYVRVGSIQQLFRSNAEMVRHFFKELLEDGKEHSTKEIVDYIFDKAKGRGVKNQRLTGKTIHSAIRATFRHDHTTGYWQTQKDCCQKAPAAF